MQFFFCQKKLPAQPVVAASSVLAGISDILGFFLFFFFLFNILTVSGDMVECSIVLLWHSLQSRICLNHPRYVPKGILLQLTWFWKCIACGLCWSGKESASARPFPGTVASVWGGLHYFSCAFLPGGFS